MDSLTQENFEEEIKKTGLNLVIFVNPGCQVCELVYPNVEEVQNLYQNALRTFKVDAKKEKDLMAQFSLKGVPQVLFFKDGKYLGKMAGPQDVADYAQKVDELLAE